MGKCISKNVPEKSSLQNARASSTTRADKGLHAKELAGKISSYSHVLKRSTSDGRASEILHGTPTFLIRSRSKRNAAPFFLQKSYSTKETGPAYCFPDKEPPKTSRAVSEFRRKFDFRRSSSTRENSCYASKLPSHSESSDRSPWSSHNRNYDEVSGSEIRRTRTLTSMSRRSKPDAYSSPERLSVDSTMYCDKPSSASFSDKDLLIRQCFSTQEANDLPSSVDEHASESFPQNLLSVNRRRDPDNPMTLYKEISSTKSLKNNQNCTSATDDGCIQASMNSIPACMPSATIKSSSQEDIAKIESENISIAVKSVDFPNHQPISRQISSPIRKPPELLRNSSLTSNLSLIPSDSQRQTCLSSQSQKENIRERKLRKLRRNAFRRRKALIDISSSMINDSFKNCNAVINIGFSPSKEVTQLRSLSSLQLDSSDSMNSNSKVLGALDCNRTLDLELATTPSDLQSCFDTSAVAHEALHSYNGPVHYHAVEGIEKDNSSTQSKSFEFSVSRDQFPAPLSDDDPITPSIRVIDNTAGSTAGLVCETKKSSDLDQWCSTSSFHHQFHPNLLSLSLSSAFDSQVNGIASNVKIVLPPSISKAVSIMEAVEELKSSSFSKHGTQYKKLDLKFSEISTILSLCRKSLHEGAHLDEAGNYKGQNTINCENGPSDLIQERIVTRDLKELIKDNSAYPNMVQILEHKPRPTKRVASELAPSMNLHQEVEASKESHIGLVMFKGSPVTNYDCKGAAHKRSTSYNVPEDQLVSKLHDRNQKASGSTLEQDSYCNLPFESEFQERKFWRSVVDSTIVVTTCGREQELQADESQLAYHPANFEPPIFLSESGISGTGSDVRSTGRFASCHQTPPIFKSTSAAEVPASAKAGAPSPLSFMQADSITMSAEEISEIWRAFEEEHKTSSS